MTSMSVCMCILCLHPICESLLPFPLPLPHVYQLLWYSGCGNASALVPCDLSGVCVSMLVHMHPHGCACVCAGAHVSVLVHVCLNHMYPCFHAVAHVPPLVHLLITCVHTGVCMSPLVHVFPLWCMCVHTEALVSVLMHMCSHWWVCLFALNGV